MSANSSFCSSPNFSLDSTLNSSINVPSSLCFEFTVSSHIFAALLASYFIFFLPLCILILHLGLQQCQKQCAVSVVTTSNLDIFTYNIIAMELIGILGGCFFSYGGYTNKLQIKMVGIYIYNIITPGQMLFHSLTSVERYVAVIHPVIYLGLRKAEAVRIRNICIVCIWVASFGWVGLTALYGLYFLSIPLTILLIFSVIITSFCSLSIVCALIRPGPGEGGGNRRRVDQLKKRALQTVMVITGTLLLKLGGDLLCILVEATGALSYNVKCVTLIFGLSSTVPSSYVMPLLFLHRAGKLPWFKYNTESGHASE